ncbi:serine hydrolase domain-containing protein [Hymenobacter chitinivorans]|uniref:CubicO group peptidase (Beta-lactamase class C family) n=1 Tax=Hymenobacter chitinivorans DSM 11115 TaxID=1121954 RepID=A0A2M9BL48_9BACT|nr:serine hydrolase domain-containing protein [Hymenobacter chitinivorans]PJJ58645.1 CubicO group peptidase (beta-lactamase class C family) [Hymenobacter chitinivorans DSM 11115]
MLPFLSRLTAFSALTLSLLAGPAPTAWAQSKAPSRFMTDSLDRYIERGMRQWQIPGLSVVVIKNGKVVVSKGYGVRAVGKSEPVDANTLFMIASNTKLFTGTALAKLEDDKKLSLNDRVDKYLPGFRLYDSVTTRLVTVRDLMGHHFGTKTFQGDFTFWDSDLSRQEIVQRMRLLKPSGQFRKDYGYCNAGFVAAGLVIPAVTGGTSWDDYVQQNFLQPLGMSNTYTGTAGFEKRANIALPYSNTFGPLTPMPFDHIDNIGPCGSMVSSVNDLAKWMQFQLDSGRYQGKQVMSWAALRKTRDPNTLLSTRKSSALPTHYMTYGLGVFSADYAGSQVFWHTGGATGFVSNVCFVPEEQLGIAILTNNDNQSFFEALRYQILDSYLGVPYTNRSAAYLPGARTGDQETYAAVAKLQKRVAQKKKLPLALDAYTGQFSHPLFGPISIAKQGKQLLVSFSNHPNLTATLDYMDGQEFRATYSNPTYGIFPAVFKVEGQRVASVEMRINPFIEYDSYLFSRL